MLRTRMLSLIPSTPGRSEQIPRTTTSIWAPSCDAAYSSSMIAASVSAFIFSLILAVLPGGRRGADRSDLLDQSVPQVVRRDQDAAEPLRAREAGEVVEEVRDVRGDVLVGREEPEVLVEAGSARVVVARADVDVAAQRRHLRGG